jgi:hypothetical protein
MTIISLLAFPIRIPIHTGIGIALTTASILRSSLRLRCTDGSFVLVMVFWIASTFAFALAILRRSSPFSGFWVYISVLGSALSLFLLLLLLVVLFLFSTKVNTAAKSYFMQHSYSP